MESHKSIRKRFTTSAQKTLHLPVETILRLLEEKMSEDESLSFRDTKHPNIREAKLPDGSTLAIAGFEKGSGKTLAMIDFKHLPAGKDRASIQRHLKSILQQLFGT